MGLGSVRNTQLFMKRGRVWRSATQMPTKTEQAKSRLSVHLVWIMHCNWYVELVIQWRRNDLLSESSQTVSYCGAAWSVKAEEVAVRTLLRRRRWIRCDSDPVRSPPTTLPQLCPTLPLPAPSSPSSYFTFPASFPSSFSYSINVRLGLRKMRRRRRRRSGLAKTTKFDTQICAAEKQTWIYGMDEYSTEVKRSEVFSDWRSQIDAEVFYGSDESALLWECNSI